MKKCQTGGKPSTWFPPGGLVEQRNHADKRPPPTNAHNDKEKNTQPRNKIEEAKHRKATIEEKGKKCSDGVGQKGNHPTRVQNKKTKDKKR